MIILEMIMGYFGPVIAIMIWVVTAVASWRVFEKAGVAGWKAMIPIYREYQIFKMCWTEKMFLFYVVTAAVCAGLEMLASRAGDLSIYGAIGAVVNIVVIYFEVVVKMRLAGAFGRSRGFGLFLYFLELFGMASLAFGPYEYYLNETPEDEQ